MGRLDTILLWGHSLAEYQQMFDLHEQDLGKSILDYGAGPASFNAEMHAQGHHVISCDELYCDKQATIAQRLEKEFQQMRDNVKQHPERFVWQQIPDVAALEQRRRAATAVFLQDYALGQQQGRYCGNSYPDLPFAESTFELALASHAVFTTHSDKPAEYVIAMLRALTHIAQEVRVFPLLADQGDISPLVGPVLLGLQQHKLNIEVRQVAYQFQRGGNAMLRVWVDSCRLR